MRPLLIAACLACALATQSVDKDDAVKKVLRTWCHNKEVEVFEHPEAPRKARIAAAKDEHHRSNAAAVPVSNAMSQISASRSCNTPGYTGEFCEFPICFETNPKLPYIPDDETVAIDAATLAFCTQTYVIFVDETMFDITIDLDMDSPLNPSFALEGEDGQAYLPDGILTQTRDQFQAFYAWLPPGRYLVIPTADLTTSSCILSIRSRTLITINAGFLVGEGTETERSDSPQSYTFYNEPASVVLHANFLRSPAKLQSINFIGEENTLYRPRLLSSRFNCSYEYIFESFYCKKTGSYLYQVEGVTFQGFNFRRLFTFSCLMNPETTVAPPSTPAPTQPSKCSNNGVLITNLDGTTYCYCMGLFTGADCAQRVCANGGTPDANNKCLCQDGFIGEFCENVYCSDNTGMTFDAEHPTLTLVVRTRTQLADVINQVSGAVQSLVNDLTFDPEYLTHFVLVLFNNNTVNTNTYPSASLLLTALNDASKTKDASGGCTDVDLIALGAALSQYLTYKSPVYVITDALPSDGSEADNDYHLINDWRSPVYFIYLEPLVEAGCQTTIEDPAYRIMDTVAQRSAGQTFYFKDRTGIRNFLTQHMLNTLYRTQLLLSNDLQLCREQNVFKSISVDSSVELLVIVATGNGISLVLTTPDGDFADADKVFTDGMNHIWVYNGPHTGNWLFSFLTTDATQGCNYKVYQSVYHANAGRSNQMDLFWSTSINLDSDVGLPQPLYGLQHAFVMHLTNYPVGVPPERVQAFLTISANRGGKPTQVYASNGIWRDVCTYNFYFPPFACKIPNELFHFNFFAQDLLGFAIQRAGVMYCAEFSPPPPPQSECQNGGVMNAANTTCFCPPGFTGDTCTQVVCFNGGKYVGNQCSCPVGWTGSFCEIAKCVDKGFSPEFMLENVDMIFMVELTAQAHAQLVFLNMQFADMIRDIQAQSRTWINRFYLVGYNSTWADVMAVSTTRDPHNIVDEMTKLASQIPTDTGCRVQLWQGLEKVLRWNIPMGSFVQIFQTSPEDNGNLDNVGQLYDALRSLFINTNGFLSFTPTFTPNGFACNASQIDYATMFMMTGGSAGTVYPIQPANTANMVQVIPLQYSSAQVYGQFSFHCKQPMEVYFPIDAYTQTIQLDTFGFQKTVQIFDGNGKAVDAFNLMSDPFSGWDIYELRKDCEDGWDKFGQYCLQFVVSAMNYTDAQNFCHQAGGSIVDDMNDGKHQFIASTAHGFNFWIGLYNNASMYLWDRPDYVDPLPLSQTKQYWVGGMGEPVYDPNAACVYWDDSVTNSNTWTLGSCASKLPFICQKHQYDKDHRPNVIGDDDLPAGKWSVSITVAPTAGQLEVCSVAVRVQSSLQIITGFTTDVAQDYPYLDPIFDSQSNRLITYVHSLDNAHRAPVLTHSIIMDAYNGTFYNAATYQPRVGCSFPWVSQTFACPNGQQAINEIIIAHIGEDEFGNMFQRLTFAHCNEADLTCNGGIRYNGSCVCTEYWTGRYCTVPICVNGGVLSASDTTCICPKGYTGPNCQLEMCTKRSPLAFSMDYKTLVLVVEVTQQNMNVVKELISSLSSIVQTATANNPNWFVNYVLVTFDSTGSTSKASFTTIGALVLSLNSAANRATDAGKCTLPIYTAIKDALVQGVSYPNSELFVITAAGPSDGSSRSDAVEEISDAQTHVNYIFASTATCGSAPPDASLTPMVTTAYNSGGNVAFVESANVKSYLSAFLPTLYSTSVLTNPTFHSRFTCAGNTDWYVEVDRNTSSIFVSTTSQYGSLGVINPLNQNMAAMVLFNSGQTKLYEIVSDGLPGIYTLTLNSPGACYAHVYALGGAKVFTEFAFTSADDPLGSHNDGMVPHPSVGVSNIATFHLYGRPGQEGILQYVEVYSPDTGDLVMRSELYPRGLCAFEYYSDSFTCGTESLEFMVYGMDEYNQQFRRLEQFFCYNHSHTAVTTVPPPVTLTGPVGPTTQPGTVSTGPLPVVTTTPQAVMSSSPKDHLTTAVAAMYQFDVVFLIDVSQEASGRLDDMNNFVASVMSGYDVSQQNARVALIVVGSTTLGSITAANLDTIDSQSNLLKYLMVVSQFTDYDNAGQAIAAGLNIAVNNQFMLSGYRNQLKNHVLIYVTATTKFDDQPQPIATKILQAGSYGIITVGYGPLVTDLNALQGLSGGAKCTFTANDAASLLGKVSDVRQLINNADTNGGKYCN